MPVITAIKPARRRANCFQVYLDGQFAFTCRTPVVARFRLREGLELSPETIAQVEASGIRQACFDKGLALLAARQLSRADLARKLRRRDWGESIIQQVLDRLSELNYLDDDRFARAKAQSDSRVKLHAPSRILATLARSGVARDVAKLAVAQTVSPEQALAAARRLVEKHLPRLRRLEPPVAHRRLTGLLARRGFDADLIRRVLRETRSGDDAPDWTD